MVETILKLSAKEVAGPMPLLVARVLLIQFESCCRHGPI
jgi:hypothetical protein